MDCDRIGMLELPGLLVGPWLPRADTRGAVGPGASTALRAVLDPASRARLGVVRPRARSWSGWFGREALEVFEAEDESLLCTVCAPWWLMRAWEIYDAEERRVAIVRGPEILDGFGSPLAVLHRAEAGRARKFLSEDGVELGEWMVRGEESLLQFSATVVSQPFAKMALLGVLLCQG